MMNKTLLTAALACVLAIGGFTASAGESVKIFKSQDKVTFGSTESTFKTNGTESLKVLIANPFNTTNDKKIKLSEFLKPITIGETSYSFGYQKIGTDNKTQFVSLSAVLSNADRDAADKSGVAAISLGGFKKGETIRFGYGDGNGKFIDKASASLVTDPKSDALFYAGYDHDGFFKLDFAEDPFRGNIEIMVIGEPLPPATVTLLIALAAGAAFLLYSKRRRERPAEQA